MPTVLEKLEALADVRLRLPPGRSAALEITRFKEFKRLAEGRLKMLHRSGASGLDFCHIRAGFIDILLRRLWDAARNSLSGQAQKEFPPLALVAIGGYGRGELNPLSDLDFMLLHDGQVVGGTRALPHLSRMLDGILLPLFDLGFKVGHSVRTVADCVQVANMDMQSKTALTEARLISGSESLFAKFQKAVLSKCVSGHEDEYIAARLEDQAQRHEKFGNSATMQEPNIKNGCGGLRDYQNLHWMAFFRHRTRTLAEMQQRGLINPGERKQLEAAYDFLLTVRTELHYEVGRSVDVLTKSLQPTVAHYLGYTDRSPSKRLERFMRDLYLRMRNIYLITRTLEERLALAPTPSRLPSLRKFIRRPLKQAPEQLVDGFKFANNQIHASSARVFRDQPRRLMRVFLHAQQRGLKLHPDVTSLLRQDLALVDRGFLHEEHVRETFLEILNQRGNVASVLRSMHEVGLLGKYIPEFGKLTCLVQHEFFHVYAADEHTLMCLEQLDRIWGAEQEPLGKYRELFQDLEQPFVLYLALLLHDAGKANHTGQHALAGGQLALRVAKRLRLDGVATHALRLVIEHHLAMAMVAQRRDIEDPAVIHHFATQMQTPPNLRMLTLLTVADAYATSAELWNGFKDSLHWRLYQKTLQALAGGTAFIRAEEKQKELLAEEVWELSSRLISREEIEAHFSTLPPRYYQMHSAREIVADLTLAHHFLQKQVVADLHGLEPVTDWHNEPDRGHTTVKVCTWDRAGLFSKIAGSFSASGINILSALVFTRTDGIVLDTFYVTEARTGDLVPKPQRDAFDEILLQALTEGVDLRPLIARQRLPRPLYQPLAWVQIPTRIHFDDTVSETRTVLEVETEDRVGLLYAISQVLSECRLDISLAKISTEKGAAIDTFYICEADGQKVASPERQRFIDEQLRAAIAALDQ